MPMLRKWPLSRAYGVLIAFGLLLAVIAMVLHGSVLCEGDNEPSTIETAKQTAATYGFVQYDEQYDSITPWLCNFSIGDLAFAFFTYCLTIVGWAMLKSAAENVRAVEGANVFFALGDGGVRGSIFDGAIQANNTGRSPAFLLEYFIGFSQTEPAGAKPLYRRTGTFYSEVLSLVVAAGRAVDLNTVQVDVAAEPYVFGFFKYRDIFRKVRTSRFCLKFDAATGRLLTAGQPAWNAWD